MKEKPRLKETEEIFNALTQKGPMAARRLIEEGADGDEEMSHPLQIKRPRRRARIPSAEPELSGEPDRQDDRPLDIGKYELSKPEQGEDPQAGKEPGGEKQPASPTDEGKGAALPPAQKEKKPKASKRAKKAEKKPPVAEAPRPAPPVPAQPAASQPDTAAPPKGAKEVKEYIFPRMSRQDLEASGVPISPAKEEPPLQEFRFEDLEPDLPQEAAPPQEPPEPEDPEAEASAAEFMDMFAQETRKEEEARSQEFKDTLAQKFMREREKYLKELGIGEEDEDDPFLSEPEPRQRRTLDYQIQPEMHLQPGETAPVRPVTYGPGGAVRPMEAAGEVAPSGGKPGKKSSEQLLQELAAQAEAAARRLDLDDRPAKGAATRMAGDYWDESTPQAPFKSKFLNKRTGVLLGTVAAALLLVVGGWRIAAMTQAPDVVDDLPPVIEDVDPDSTLTVYTDRTFSERGMAADVLIKRPNVTVTNLSVSNLLVISDIDADGWVRLSDVSVDGAIHVRSSAINTLELDNVKTSRIIISNAASPVTVRLSGDSDVGTVEMKTPGVLEQGDLAGDALGVRSLLVKAENEGDSMNATLKSAQLPTVTAMGETVLSFDNSFVENMTADGSLSLSGSGRIINLSVGADSGVAEASGILDISQAIKPASSLANTAPVSVILKGVEVTNLNMKTQADLTISTAVDNMSLADNINVMGNGTIGSLAINERFGNSRLKIDLAGITATLVTAEAEVRVNAIGTARINTFAANASSYVLGNKVNHLIVNNSNVIYENEPDKITVGSGVRPPETVAQNPNLDYELGTGQREDFTDATEDEHATTCGHTREMGGYLIGDGSAANPFEVSTPMQLAHVEMHLTSHFVQTQDIDIADDSEFTSGFTSIASSGTRFSGEYDGRRYRILNLRVYSDKETVGLFGENIGTIRNIRLSSGEINATMSQSAFVGGIVGYNYDGGQVIACSNAAKVTGQSAYVGGIVGYNYNGKIRDCYNAAKVSATSNVGGIVGVNRQNASVAGSYNVGTIEGTTAAGGIAGVNQDAHITNCYFLADTASEGIGQGEGSASEKTSEQMRSDQMVLDLTAGNEDSLWAKGSQQEGEYNYPMLTPPAAEKEDDEEPETETEE